MNNSGYDVRFIKDKGKIMEQDTHIAELEKIVGKNKVTNKDFDMVNYARDQGILSKGRPPDYVVRPDTIEDVQKVIKYANEKKIPVYPKGAYTSPFGYYPKEGGIVIDLAVMSRILGIHPESLSCKVEPGVTWGELDTYLYDKGYQFLISPEGALGGTVGGHVANRGSSPMCFLVANQADCVTGLKVVSANGDIITTGAMANPYAREHFMRYTFMSDLTGLFLGAEGSLGVIVEIGLKIEKYPEATGHAAYEFQNIDDAANAVYNSRLHMIPAKAVLVHDGRTMDAVDPERVPHPAWMVSYARLSGTQVQVDDSLKLLDKICKEANGKNMGPGIPARYWTERYRAVAGFLYSLGSRMSFHFLVPLGEFSPYYKKVAAKAEEIREKYKIGVTTTGHPCDRSFLIILSVHCHERDEEEWKKARSIFQEMREPLIKEGAGFYRVGLDYASDLLPITGNYYKLLKEIKKLLDPNRIMAPGFGNL